jgi:hypothetical protein
MTILDNKNSKSGFQEIASWEFTSLTAQDIDPTVGTYDGNYERSGIFVQLADMDSNNPGAEIICALTPWQGEAKSEITIVNVRGKYLVAGRNM